MHMLEACTYFSQKYLQNSKTKNSTKKYTTRFIAVLYNMCVQVYEFIAGGKARR